MMMMRTIFAIALFFAAGLSQAASDLDYLPRDVSYDPAVPTPESVLGYPVGTWHVRPDQIVSYMQTLAASSERMQLQQIGHSHEQRPLLLATFSRPDRLADLEAVRSRHLNNLATGRKAGQEEPLVLWMGYSVHGNEPSGSNAALLVAYYLAAAQGPEIEQLLDNAVIHIDPSLNPDGLGRFAQWVNGNKGQQLVADSQHREHVEPWPTGRTNHYMADLNRDWLLLTHPESRARIKQFQRWRPHLLTDFHEMGTNSSYFFQPGIPSRRNPNTSLHNEEVTALLGQFHANALDKRKQLYFTQESYDDFYYGKGSTYPDALGSIGILFEQASSRGHLQDSIHGPLSFTATIQNQVTTSLSSFTGAMASKAQLQAYQAGFVQTTAQLAKADKRQGYLVGGEDPYLLELAADLLRAHGIEVKGLNKSVRVDKVLYRGGKSLFIPVQQAQYRLITSLFSTRTDFTDNTFYDVSNWNLAYAFNLAFTPLSKSQVKRLSLSDYVVAGQAQSSSALPEDALAYGFDWNHAQAPALLQGLLASDARLKVAASAFTVTTQKGKVELSPGSVVIPMGLPQPDDLHGLLSSLARQYQVPVYAFTSGLTPEGIDLGSRGMVSLSPVRLLLVGGEGTSSYEVGELWHFFDKGLTLPTVIVERARLGRVDLAPYSHIVLASGNYEGLSERAVKSLDAWVSKGGTLIGQTRALPFMAKQGWLQVEFTPRSEIMKAFTTDNLGYGDRERFEASQRIAGAVFATEVDASHPLLFGIPKGRLPLFKNHERVMQVKRQPFIQVARYTDSPLLAGYAADKLVKQIAGSSAIVANGYGRGKVIGFSDNPVFRGYYRGSARLMANAIYQSAQIRTAR